MANISDIIEQFILAALSDSERIELGRNDLATHFSVAPSQINYVLSTRFTTDRGYVVESRRGGGGYVVVAKLCDDCLDYLNNILDVSNELTERTAVQLIDRLKAAGLITEAEGSIIGAAISDRALATPFNMDNNIRASVMREIIIKLLNDKKFEERRKNAEQRDGKVGKRDGK